MSLSETVPLASITGSQALPVDLRAMSLAARSSSWCIMPCFSVYFHEKKYLFSSWRENRQTQVVYLVYMLVGYQVKELHLHLQRLAEEEELIQSHYYICCGFLLMLMMTMYSICVSFLVYLFPYLVKFHSQMKYHRAAGLVPMQLETIRIN